MNEIDRKKHWENIYTTKQPNEVSWTQNVPQVSLEFIHSAKLGKDAKIIDIGGGDSKLVDCLLDEGHENVTVLDISATAIERAKQRLGHRAERVNWVISDISDFVTSEQYDLWHDRAAFHFLTEDREIDRYVLTAKKYIKKNGILVIGTFSDQGPKKCSGINIRQYSESLLVRTFSEGFEKIKCGPHDHITPFDTIQRFIFCSFLRREDDLLNPV